jgi:carbon storage regulator CsrA
MLVLSRAINETITITVPDGTVITLKICETRPSKCRIGIEAPDSYRIKRGELEATPDGT